MTWIRVEPSELDEIARELRSIATALGAVPAAVNGCCCCPMSPGIAGVIRNGEAAAGHAVRSVTEGLARQAADLEVRARAAQLSAAGAVQAVSVAVPTAAGSASGPGVTSQAGFTTSLATLQQAVQPTTTIGGAGAGWSLSGGQTIGGLYSQMYGSSTLGGGSSSGYTMVPSAGGGGGSHMYTATFTPNSWNYNSRLVPKPNAGARVPSYPLSSSLPLSLPTSLPTGPEYGTTAALVALGSGDSIFRSGFNAMNQAFSFPML